MIASMPTLEENHSPASPPQANDPHEAAASIVMTHPEALSHVPPLPDLTPLDDPLQTQEWLMMTINNKDNQAPHDTLIQEEACPSFRAKPTRVSFSYKGVREFKTFASQTFKMSYRAGFQLMCFLMVSSYPHQGKGNQMHTT